MAIEIKAVSKHYQIGSVTTKALDDVTVSFPQGTFVVVLGPSGSGKSTLLNVMGGLDHVDKGTIHVDGAAIHALRDKALTLYRREKAGFIFQQYNLLQTLNVYENVEVGARLVKHPESIDAMLEKVGLTEHKHKFPHQLSGGEQQRVAIARALVKKPSVLFCDEPTGALDEAKGKEILQLLVDLNESLNTTIVLVTHNASIAALADRVIKLNSGCIVEDHTNTERAAIDAIHFS